MVVYATVLRSVRPIAGSIPTLVLHGEDDFVPVEFAARIAETVPGARLSVLPGCGHFTYLEAPERVFEEISRFCG